MWSYPQLFAHLSTASTECFSSVFYAFYVECFTYLSTDFCSCAKLTTFARTRLGISCKKVFKRPKKLMAMGWKSIRGRRLYVDRFTRKVTSGREKTNPTCVSKCHQMTVSAYKTTFLSDCNSVPIQRKSLHIRPVLCRKCIHLGWFFSLRILLWRSSDGLLSPEWPSG